MRRMDARLTADRVVMHRADGLDNCHLDLLTLLDRLPSLLADTATAAERTLTLYILQTDLRQDSGFCLDPEHLRRLAEFGCALNVVFGTDQ